MHIQELGHIVFFVRDLTTSANFYRDILGFQEIHRNESVALFSGGRTHHELLLIEVGGTGHHSTGATPGLYHVGFKIGDGPEAIRSAFAELQKHNVPIVGTGDHTVTHSIYILDPDGNELELYADITDIWRTQPNAILAPVRPLHVK